mmetsp:Transcript_95517/g.309495  ORF Transcript_95517/g.309495 Transcript_95517/m.309495 type:complete len:131 (-) Transcript_95517:1276-1668(-)
MVVPPYHLNFWHNNTPKPSNETFRARKWLPSSPTMTLKELGDDVGDMPTIDLAVLQARQVATNQDRRWAECCRQQVRKACRQGRGGQDPAAALRVATASKLVVLLCRWLFALAVSVTIAVGSGGGLTARD